MLHACADHVIRVLRQLPGEAACCARRISAQHAIRSQHWSAGGGCTAAALPGGLPHPGMECGKKCGMMEGLNTIKPCHVAGWEGSKCYAPGCMPLRHPIFTRHISLKSAYKPASCLCVQVGDKPTGSTAGKKQTRHSYKTQICSTSSQTKVDLNEVRGRTNTSAIHMRILEHSSR